MASMKIKEAGMLDSKHGNFTDSVPEVPPPPYQLPVYTLSRVHGKHWRVFQGEGKDGPVEYYAAAHHWTSKPSLVLHEGDSTSGKAVGFSRVESSGGSARMAMGDPDSQPLDAFAYDSIWETKAWSRKNYDLQFSNMVRPDGQRLSRCTWHRTSSCGSSFEFKDSTTGELLATYHSHGVFKPGTFSLTTPPRDQAFVAQILLSLLAVREMEWRRDALTGAVAS